MGDTAGAGCNKDSCDKFGGMLVSKIEKSLERTESLQDLERRAEKDPADDKIFETLAGRLEEMYNYKKLVSICEKIGSNKELKEDVRNTARIRGYLYGGRDWSRLKTDEDRAKFADDGIQLISDLSDHPKAESLVQTLFNSGYQQRFDVPTKSQAGLEKLQKIAESSEKSDSLKKLIAKFSNIRTEWIKRTEESLKKYREQEKAHEVTLAYFSALLGDPKPVIDVFSKKTYEKNALYQGWLKEAKEKMEKEGKKDSDSSKD